MERVPAPSAERSDGAVRPQAPKVRLTISVFPPASSDRLAVTERFSDIKLSVLAGPFDKSVGLSPAEARQVARAIYQIARRIEKRLELAAGQDPDERSTDGAGTQ